MGGTLSLLQQSGLDEADTPRSLSPLSWHQSLLTSQPNQLPLGLSFPKAHYFLVSEYWGGEPPTHEYLGAKPPIDS